MRSFWVRWALNSILGISQETEKKTREEGHGKSEAQTEVMCLQAQEGQELLVKNSEGERGKGGFCPGYTLTS